MKDKIIEILSKYRIIGEQKNGGRWAEIEGEIKTEYVAWKIEDLFLNDNACINIRKQITRRMIEECSEDLDLALSDMTGYDLRYWLEGRE